MARPGNGIHGSGPAVGRVLGLAFAAALLIAPAPSGALIVGGGGGARTDCLTVFDAPANTPPSRPRDVRCTDGDVCDGDGTVNGVCQFAVAVCANSTFDPRCTLAGVESITLDHADDNDPTDTKFDPEIQAIQNAIEAGITLPTADPDQCTTSVDIHVPIDGPLHGVCRRTKKRLRMTTESEFMAGKIYKDRDRLKLTCDPSPALAGCDPHAFFPDGTFERIQRQIFNKSCAVTPCHVSNWSFMAGFLVLEPGTAHGALVDVTPVQSAAMMAGWERVDGSGDLATSLLFHKLNRTTLPDDFGDPMPRGKRRLDQDLIDIIQLWIEAGAPDTGWVPGTDQ
jgi:hypothetical protein